MNGKSKHLILTIGAAIAAASMVILSTSCNALYEDLPECDPSTATLRFVYDYNMERANAFHKQVDCLTLYIFDEEGNYVATRTERSAEQLGDEDYRMVIVLPEGNYHAVAYGGMECDKGSFRHPASTDVTRGLSDLRVELHPDCLTDDTRRALHNHYHGSVDFAISANENTAATVEMMRNTNSVQVALQHVHGSPIDVSDFDFSISDDNTLFDADNKLIPAGEIAYLPYEQLNFTTGTAEGRADDGAITEVRAAVARFHTSRLYKQKPTSPTLLVTRHSDGSTVLRLPIINYMLMFKENHDATSPMSDQEYLDRENSWRFVFFLNDSDNSWISTKIVVNDWHVVINNSEF